MTTPTPASSTQRVLIVGGVAGGASAAARLRRLSEHAQVTVFERGEHVSFANCGLPYHIAGTIKDRSRLLVQTPESLRARFALDVRTRTEVLRINRDARTLTVRDLATNTERDEPYDALVLSPGAEPVRPPLPGINSPRVMTLRNMADMDAINKRLNDEKPQRALVIGGGYIGLEMAEALRHRGVGVVLIELADQVMNVADPEMVAPLHDELLRQGVDLRLGVSVKSFAEENGQLVATLSTGETVAAGLAVLAIGVKPEVKLAREAGLALGPRGGILVDAGMKTSDPAIYAVGDAVEVTDFVTDTAALIPLAGPANRQGRIAADNILGRSSTYKKTQGTAICKVFDKAIAMTGASEKALKRNNLTYEKVYVHPHDHASYYPGAQQFTLKLLFDPATGKVLGAQAVGSADGGIDKRIDVLAVAIRAGLTVYDLEELELTYAPPFGSAKDAVNYAGFVASNILRGDMAVCHVDDVRQPKPDQALLDVRSPEEFAAGSIPGSINIPVDALRSRISELPRDKEYLVNCAVGLRGYLACRILAQHGIRCRNLSGGYKTWQMANAKVTPPQKPTDGGPSGGHPAPTAASAPAPTAPAPAAPAAPSKVHQIDATGLACPGPVMRLRQAYDAAAAGEAIEITVSDAGFAKDIRAWAATTGAQLLNVNDAGKTITAMLLKPAAACGAAPVAAPSTAAATDKTIVVFSGDLDRALASLIIANGAAAMGHKVTLFFTFWGLNVLRKPVAPAVNKSLIERMFGWMMPRGANRLTLSKMHMAGMGTAMIKGIMKKHNVPNLESLIASARAAGVRLVACTMTMDLMGFKREELLEGVELGGVAAYLESADKGKVNLFI